VNAFLSKRYLHINVRTLAHMQTYRNLYMGSSGIQMKIDKYECNLLINRFMIYKVAEVPLFQAYVFRNVDTAARSGNCVA
jgi:hypothetical protein